VTEREKRLKTQITKEPEQASTAQINYMEILFEDLGFDRKARNAFLTVELKREIRYLDSLTMPEASRVIASLLDRTNE